MKHLFIPGCYFPTTTIFIDDNRKYFTSLGSAIDKEITNCRFFDNGHDAIDYLKTLPLTPHFMDHVLESPDDPDESHGQVDINLSGILQIIEDPNRFDQTAVIAVDYSMPDMDGISVSEKIRAFNPNYKIILLTGEASHSHAVGAFNAGLIDYYIGKEETNFNEKLNGTIHKLQLEYFQDCTQLMINNLTHHPDYPPSCLNDAIFMQFFNKLIREKAISEYYLFEERGSFLMLNAKGQPSWLVVKDTEMMDSMVFDVEYCDFDAPENILSSLKARTHMLFFYQHDELWEKPEKWSDYLFPCTTLEGNQTFYYAFITALTPFDKDFKKIKAYQDFLGKGKK